MGGMGGNHQALVSLWETRTAAHRDRNYAADVSAAMLVQPVGRGRRGGHLRQQRQPMSMTSPQRQNCCERTMRPSTGTAHIWDWKNGMKSSMTHSFPPSNTGSAAARARLPRVSDNAIDWERYIESRKSSVRCKVEHPFRIVKTSSVSERRFTVGCEKISTDYMCSLPA